MLSFGFEISKAEKKKLELSLLSCVVVLNKPVQ